MALQRDPEETEPKILFDLLSCSHLRMLEIGCGDGRLTWRYAREAEQVVGIDIDIDSLQKARQDLPANLGSKVTFTLANSESLPFPPELFDAAVLGWSL
jgi:ubiquinone/menaquinone biosynthesis C-methylase UbiE